MIGKPSFSLSKRTFLRATCSPGKGVNHKKVKIPTCGLALRLVDLSIGSLSDLLPSDVLILHESTSPIVRLIDISDRLVQNTEIATKSSILPRKTLTLAGRIAEPSSGVGFSPAHEPAPTSMVDPPAVESLEAVEPVEEAEPMEAVASKEEE